jgi:hypothetical protein
VCTENHLRDFSSVIGVNGKWKAVEPLFDVIGCVSAACFSSLNFYLIALQLCQATLRRHHWPAAVVPVQRVIWRILHSADFSFI